MLLFYTIVHPHIAKRLLPIYKYVEKGTIEDQLHGNQAKPVSIPWSIHLKITIGTTEVLVYLHNFGVIYHDIKTSNIVLKNDYMAKLGDFVVAY